jgi:hypothetical protein
MSVWLKKAGDLPDYCGLAWIMGNRDARPRLKRRLDSASSRNKVWLLVEFDRWPPTNGR